MCEDSSSHQQVTCSSSWEEICTKQYLLLASPVTERCLLQCWQGMVYCNYFATRLNWWATCTPSNLPCLLPVFWTCTDRFWFFPFLTEDLQRPSRSTRSVRALLAFCSLPGCLERPDSSMLLEDQCPKVNIALRLGSCSTGPCSAQLGSPHRSSLALQGKKLSLLLLGHI